MHDPARPADAGWRSDLKSLTGTRRARILSAVVLAVALVARVPGVFWGANFPPGYGLHHPDEWTHIVYTEILVAPSAQPRWDPLAYPVATAALVAAPLLAMRIATGELGEAPPRPSLIAMAGRTASVLFGVATVAVVMLFATRLLADPRVGLAAGAFLALGGLHVSQSHLFLADVPGLFWWMAGLYLILVHLDTRRTQPREPYRWSAFAMGAAFGTKLFVAGLPSLAIASFFGARPLRRIIHGLVFFAAGFAIVNFFAFSLEDLYEVASGGYQDPYVYSRAFGALLYLVEVPSVIGLPMVLLGLAGLVAAVAYVRDAQDRDRRWAWALVVALPILLHLYSLIFQVDHFPRHMIPFVPWAAVFAGAGLVTLIDRGRVLRERPALALVPVFAYMGLFVFDGERVYIDDPRNKAARWVQENVPVNGQYWWNRHRLRDYDHVRFPEVGRPPVLVIEMMDANHYLSGMGWRNSHPTDARNVYDMLSQDRLEEMQALFGMGGSSEYREVARFGEGYFMPEYVLTDRLIGNRSRNYVTEVVIFRRDEAAAEEPAAPADGEPAS